MSGAWSQLEQLLTCAICLDRYRNPKLLPCQHTFCGEPCMEGLVDYARRQIKCPECRAEHRLPYNGVQQFPNNVTLGRFLDLHRSITGEEPEPLPSQMDRCSVCGEKSYCNRCAHCEKKVCDECRLAHLDILRREINRINSQVRRGLEKLSEHAEQADKGSEKLLQITTQIRDEITESVRRLVKDLKDKESRLLEELDEFTVSETKNAVKLKEDFEVELATITSNCELAEEHITDADEWTDVELMEYKEIFLKTLDFLRNLDPDSMDFTRKIKYIQKVDLDQLRRSAADFGELKISPSPNFTSPLSPSESSNNLSVPGGSLVRSQSDHRLAQQFSTPRSQRSDPLQRSYLDVTGGNRYGSDSEKERGSSPPGKRYGSVHERSTRYGRTDNNDFGYTRGWPRPGDSDYEPSNSANFRSRFMRERIRERVGNSDDHSLEEHDSDISPAHRVRFQEEQQPQSRTKLFDTEEMANMRAPLSGLIKLLDSPHVMERLHQNEIKAKQKEAEAKENESSAPLTTTTTNNTSVTSNPTPVSTPQVHRPARQISEDEIEKQKKQNQAAFSQSQQQQQQPTTPSPATATTVANNLQQSQIPKTTMAKHPYSNNSDNLSSNLQPATNRRIQAIQKEEKRSPSSSDDNSESGDITYDDEITTTPSNTSARRRVYASTHTSSGSGSNPAGGSLTNSFSQSVDYGEPSRNKYSQPSSTLTTNNSYQAQFAPPSSYFNSPASQRATITRHGNEDSSINTTNVTASSAYTPYKSTTRRTSREEERTNYREDPIISSTAPYYSPVVRRGSVNRRNHNFDDVFEPENSSNAYNQYRNKGSNTSSNDRFGSSSTYFKNRLAKSKSSHAVAYDDSDEESNGTSATNPLSPSATSSFKSRFNTGAGFNNNNNINNNNENSEPRYTGNRRTSRSGYTYRTREASPEEESAGSVTQYLINKYGTRSTNRPTALSKSKSSHVIFGRSLSSSDDDAPSSNPPNKYRRESTDYYKSPIGLTYPRQMYLQKKRVMMKIGSRGTNPGCFTWPRGVACAPDNGIVVADSSNHRIQVFDSTGRFQFEFGSYGSGEGEFDCLAGVTVNRIGHFIVSDRYNHRVQVFDPSGRFLRAFGSEGRSDGKFSYPWGIATDALGFIYVCDKENHRIQVFQSDGTFVGKFGSIGSRAGMLEHPHYIAVSSTNRIIVSDSNNHRIQVFDINGRSISMFGSEGSGDGQFKFPRGVAVDENGFVIVGDSGNNRIQIFNPDGTFLKTFGQWGSGEGEFKGLEGVAISSTGNILVCDRENHRIQVF